MRATLQAQRLYVIDRGYADYQLFQDVIAAKSNFIGRIRDNAVWKLIEERPLTPAARAAGAAVPTYDAPKDPIALYILLGYIVVGALVYILYGYRNSKLRKGIAVQGHEPPPLEPQH